MSLSQKKERAGSDGCSITDHGLFPGLALIQSQNHLVTSAELLSQFFVLLVGNCRARLAKPLADNGASS